MKKVAQGIPEWLKILPKDAMLSAKEFAKALGISQQAFSKRLLSGDIPRNHKTYIEMTRESGYFNVSSSSRAMFSTKYWPAVCVRNHIRQEARKAKSAVGG